MQIGLINLFPSRPYFQHLIYFRYSLEQAGHKTDTFFCQGGDLSCYYKKQHSSIPSFLNCFQCKLRRNTAKDKGYAVTDYVHTRNMDSKPQIPDSLYASFKKICKNSFSTIHRIEELQDINEFYDSKDLEQDIYALNVFYNAVVDWINKVGVEKVILFNGRMDLMAAACLACENTSVSFFCYEGTFFGKGTYFFENANCLSLKHWKDCCLKFIDKPLKVAQAEAALEILKARLNRNTDLEWRSYFEKQIEVSEKINITSKVLVLLSSTNEVFGADDYKTGWHNYLEGVDEIIKTLNIDSKEVIVRGHPVWATNICGIGGEKIEDIYRSWAIKKEYKYIASDNKLDTQFLIKNTENVIINYSSAFFEAAYFDKRIFLTHSGYYDFSGIALKVDHPDKLGCIKKYIECFNKENNQLDRLKKLLRFTYIAAYRLPALLEDIAPQDKLSWVYSIDAGSVADDMLALLNKDEYPYSDFSYNRGIEDEELDCVSAILKAEDGLIVKSDIASKDVDSEKELSPISKFIKNPVPRLILKLEKLVGKGDYLGV